MDEQECIWQGVLYRQTVPDLLYANLAVIQLYLLTGADPHIIIQAKESIRLDQRSRLIEQIKS